jgi:hypothetical protein
LSGLLIVESYILVRERRTSRGGTSGMVCVCRDEYVLAVIIVEKVVETVECVHNVADIGVRRNLQGSYGFCPALQWEVRVGIVVITLKFNIGSSGLLLPQRF